MALTSKLGTIEAVNSTSHSIDSEDSKNVKHKAMIKNLFQQRDGLSSAQVSSPNISTLKPKTAKSRHKSLHTMFHNQWELQKEYA
jgi:hypothetical protein